MFVERNCSLLRAPAARRYRHVLEREADRVQHDPRRRLVHLDANCLGALEARVMEVDRESQVVVLRGGRRRQPLGQSRRGSRQDKKDNKHQNVDKRGGKRACPHSSV